MNDAEWFENALRSKSPSERQRAAIRLASSPGIVDRKILIRALQRESVPQTRGILNDALAEWQLHSDTTGGEAGQGGSHESGIPELARLIRHELSPPIGWIRRAANSEIADFSRSATADAIHRLERRIDSLIALIRQDSEVTLAEYSLEETLRRCWPEMEILPTFTPSSDLVEADPKFATDFELVEMLLANIYQNALDAAQEADSSEPVHVTWGVAGGRFWVRVSNPFMGTQFDIEHVEMTGISTKIGHQGIGMSLIKTAAEKLGYEFKISGKAGLAAFTLTGKRW